MSIALHTWQRFTNDTMHCTHYTLDLNSLYQVYVTQCEYIAIYVLWTVGLYCVLYIDVLCVLNNVMPSTCHLNHIDYQIRNGLCSYFVSLAKGREYIVHST